MTETKPLPVLAVLDDGKDPLLEEIRLGIHKVSEAAAREYIMQLKEKAEAEARKLKESQEETAKIIARIAEIEKKIMARNENLAKQNVLLDKISQELSK